MFKMPEDIFIVCCVVVVSAAIHLIGLLIAGPSKRTLVRQATPTIDRLEAEEIHRLRQENINAHERYMALAGENSSLQRRNDDLHERLAAEMGSKIAEDESTFENLNIEARPMNIAKEYDLLYSNKWLDAKQALDRIEQANEATEEKKITFLLIILTTCYEFAAELFSRKKSEIKRMLKNPDMPFHNLGHEDSSSETDDRQLRNNLIQFSDALRIMANHVKLGCLRQEVYNILSESEENRLFIEIEEVNTYLSACTRIAWKMAIQRPPMTLVYNKVAASWPPLGIEGLNLMWNSKTSPEAVVKYYKKPQMYHGGRLMSKGEVFVANS